MELQVTHGYHRYRFLGYRTVHGYTEPPVFGMLEALDRTQRVNGVEGAVAEVGVHHGQLFIGLHLLQQPGERSLAVDVFDQQELNIDGSGKGDLDKFRQNVARWASLDGVAIHRGDSTQLGPSTVERLVGDVRLFSIDGGHTEDIVYSDMHLADAALTDGGVVIADDVFNQQWPGVAVGTLRYMEEGALSPFYIGFNKVLFAKDEWCDTYRKAMDAAFSGRMLTAVGSSVFAGHEVGILVRVPRTPAHLLRRNSTARNLYHGLRSRLLGAKTSTRP